jgi:hypothetical protein
LLRASADRSTVLRTCCGALEDLPVDTRATASAVYSPSRGACRASLQLSFRPTPRRKPDCAGTFSRKLLLRPGSFQTLKGFIIGLIPLPTDRRTHDNCPRTSYYHYCAGPGHFPGSFIVPHSRPLSQSHMNRSFRRNPTSINGRVVPSKGIRVEPGLKGLRPLPIPWRKTRLRRGCGSLFLRCRDDGRVIFSLGTTKKRSARPRERNVRGWTEQRRPKAR